MIKMVEKQKQRVENEMTNLVEEIDKTHLRKMQRDMHKCAAVCCDYDEYNIQKVHSCIENCGSTLHKAQQYVQTELERIQNRLQRCIMECNDNIKDKIGVNPSQEEVNRFSEEFESCATICVDKYCDLLPTFAITLKNVLSEKFKSK